MTVMGEHGGHVQETLPFLATPLPFLEAADSTLRAYRMHGLAVGHSRRTLDARADTVRSLYRAEIDPLTTDGEALVEWLATRRGRDGGEATRSTRATYRAHLRSFFGWLHSTGRRSDNPAASLPQPRVHRNTPRPITTEQLQAVAEACSDWRARQTLAYVALAAYAGLRVHEIAKFHSRDYGPDEITVTGKGGRTDTLPTHPVIAALADSMPHTGYWFSSDTDLGHVSRVSVGLAITRAMKRAGVPGTPHALRHYYGTQVLWSSGGDLRTTQRALRHASPASTAIYTQVADETLTRAIQGIPA